MEWLVVAVVLVFLVLMIGGLVYLPPDEPVLMSVLAAMLIPFFFVLACIAFLCVLIFSTAARAKFFSDQRHK